MSASEGLMARNYLLDIGAEHFLGRYGLKGARVSLSPDGRAVALRHEGVTFAQGLEIDDAADAQAVVEQMDSCLNTLAQYAKRKLQRTPRCYLPR